MNHDQDSKKSPQYADSSISDKAFKRMIFWFFIYCTLFCVVVILAVGADHSYLN